MPKDLTDRNWLESLLMEDLERYDAVAARARLPDDVRAASSSPLDLAASARLLVARSLRRRRLAGSPATPTDVFLDDVRADVQLALDLALLRGEPFQRIRQRAEIAAFLAAAVGAHDLALEVTPERPGGASDRAVERALRAAGDALRERFFPPGDPLSGVPLHTGAVAVLRRRLARVAMSYHRADRLAPEPLARHGEYAERESLLLAEALAGLLRSAGPADPRSDAVRQRQLGRLGLSRAGLREARRRIAAPRSPEALAADTPERVRPFLLEQLLLGQLRTRLPGEEPVAFVQRFVAAAGLDPETIAQAQVEAAAQHGDHQAWFEALGGGVSVEWQKLSGEWEAMTDQVVERVSSAVTENLDALAIEIRETGELGTLLAKAAAGTTLTAEERRKVKAQLIDLAKAVPALALFAAPGGMLLLPLVAKLLPFSLMPSAWDRTTPRPGALAPVASLPATPLAGNPLAGTPLPGAPPPGTPLPAVAPVPREEPFGPGGGAR